MTGPLHGVRVLEFEGLGPGPMASMILAQQGADVIVVRRTQRLAVKAALGASSADEDIIERGKRALSIDLKRREGVDLALRLVEQTDVLIEGNRPGVMERLGLGPDVCLARNPRLVYGRMTGWGQHGPLAAAAGHDLNYVALTGLLSVSARPGDRPIVPPTVIGDAGGALGLAFGVVAALLEARSSGRGQVIDAAIVDIVAMLGALVHSTKAGGQIASGRPSPFHDSPFYDVYRCADGRDITLGALEPQFYALLLDKLGLSDVDPRTQYDTAAWPGLKARSAAVIASRTQADWCRLLEGSDVCFAPVLDIDEATRHPHVAARQSLVQTPGGAVCATPAPRFARTTATLPDARSDGGDALLRELGLDDSRIAALRDAGVVG
jgi:alpha-methylacyl-CoA racemase